MDPVGNTLGKSLAEVVLEEVAVGNTFGLNQGEVVVEEEPVGNTLALNMGLVLVVLVDNIPGSYWRRIVGDLAADIHGGKLGSMVVPCWYAYGFGCAWDPNGVGI